MSFAYDAQAIIAGELGWTTEQLKAYLDEDPENALALNEKLASTNLLELPLTVEAPLEKHDGALLIGAGEALNPKLKSFLRLATRNDGQSWPSIAPNDQLDAHIRKKLIAQYEEIRRRLMTRTGEFVSRIFSQSRHSKDLAIVLEVLDDVMIGILKNSAMLRNMASFIAEERSKDLLVHPVRRACLSMAVYRFHKEAGIRGMAKELETMGASAVLQHVSFMNQVDESPNHAIESAGMAERIGVAKSGVDAIRNHHRTRGSDGRPILQSGSPNLFERVLVTVNTLESCLADSPNSRMWVLYVLHSLAKDGFLDPECVRVLGGLYGGSFSNMLITSFIGIIKQCPAEQPKAFPWSLFEGIPRTIICCHTQCPINVMGGPRNLVIHNPIEAEIAETKLSIPRGEYFRCPYLMALLLKQVGKLRSQLMKTD